MGKFTVTILVEDYAGYDSAFFAEHGFAALISHEYDSGNIYRVLLDCGTSGDVLVHNMKALEIDPASIDLLAFSHCHYDHTGGLLELLKAREGKPLTIVAHPDIRRKTWTLEPDWRLIGMPEGFYQESIDKYQASWILSKVAVQLGEGLYWLGQIPSTTPVALAKDLLTVVDEQPCVDPMLDDTAIVIDLGTEIAIVAGCSHAGAINIVRHAKGTTPDKKITAYIGGLHLISSPRGTGTAVGKALITENVSKVFAGHCTGFNAEKELSELPEINFAKLHCGKVIEFFSRD